VVKFKIRLLKYSICAVVIWYLACVGTGLYLRPFILLCNWPVALLHFGFPNIFPRADDELSWTTVCLTSLGAWLLVAVVASVVAHKVSTVRRYKTVAKT
jgi:hypothetical protein